MMDGKLILPGLVIALLVSATLWAIASAHFYWGAGGIWPSKDEKSLARTVVGAPRITSMPAPLACITVAALLAVLGVLPLVLIGVFPGLMPRSWALASGAIAVLVFTARGYAAYRSEFRSRFPEEPFATLDRRFYAPLCFAIGFGFLFLIVAG